MALGSGIGYNKKHFTLPCSQLGHSVSSSLTGYLCHISIRNCFHSRTSDGSSSIGGILSGSYTAR